MTPSTSRYVTAREGSPSGLSDAEREVVFGLAIAAIARRFKITSLAASVQLDRAAGRGTVRLEGDDRDVVLIANGYELVRVTRDVLRRVTAIRRPA
jgi:hypothetical protein